MDLYDKLVDYSQSDVYPFHMPGHKRQVGNPFLQEFPNPYAIDITEIDGFDNLHHAEGIIRESMDRAAKMYGADRSYYLVNGSSCGILSAVCGMTQHGGKILMSRNCHKAAYHGVFLNRLRVEYIYPQIIEGFGIQGGLVPEDVENVLKTDHDIQAVLVVSPTYDGIVSDVEKIVEICHGCGIPLIVDEAHGAHFRYHKGFPVSALDLGADVVIQSLHKTLPAFTQTSILHVKGDLVDREWLEHYLQIFQSSSPSYLFMAGIQRCIRYMDSTGRDGMIRYEERLKWFMEQMKGLQVLEVLTRDICGKYRAVAGWDPSKIVVSTMRAKDFHGEELAEMLRKNYHLEMEMTAPEYVIAMTSVLDTDEGFERLTKALLEIDEELLKAEEKRRKTVSETGDQKENTVRERAEKNCKASETLQSRILPMSICEAMDANTGRTALQNTVGKVSAEFIYLYPPGIPIIAPGEVFTREIVEMIEAYKKAGLLVQGPADPASGMILTVAEDKGF